MKKLLFFSNNVDKIEEVKKLFNNISIEIISLVDLEFYMEPKENGDSFFENAKIKSSYGFKKFGLPCFADDSGICIEALDWRPNIFSKRFLDSFKNRNDCLKYIIKKVSENRKEAAYFETSICYTVSKDEHYEFGGRINGIISKNILGNHGFGYDPIFIPLNLKKTFGQMTNEQKNILSHRSIAIKKFLSFLTN